MPKKIKDSLTINLTIKYKWFKNFLIYFPSAVFALLLLSLLIAVTFNPASPPKNVTLTNQTDRTVTVTWWTGRPVIGSVLYTKESNKLLRRVKFVLSPLFPGSVQTAYEPINVKSHVHSAALTFLEPETPYYYFIRSGFKLYRHSQGAILPSLKTPPTLSSLPEPQPVFGQVRTEDGQPFAYALLYLVFDDPDPAPPLSNTLSARTDRYGLYSFDLGNLRTALLGNTFVAQTGQKAALQVMTLEGKFKEGEIAVGSDRPAPPIIIE